LTTIVYVVLISSIHAIYPAHRTPFNFVVLLMFSEERSLQFVRLYAA